MVFKRLNILREGKIERGDVAGGAILIQIDEVVQPGDCTAGRLGIDYPNDAPKVGVGDSIPVDALSELKPLGWKGFWDILGERNGR